jgi:hypothetical protein
MLSKLRINIFSFTLLIILLFFAVSKSNSQTMARFHSQGLCYGTTSIFISTSTYSGFLDSMIWIVDHNFKQDTFRDRKIDTLKYNFLSSGVFSVTLIIKATGGNDTFSQSVVVQSIAYISFSPDTNQQYLSNNIFNFTSNVIINPSGTVSYLWKFGDGHVLASTNPSYTYGSAGVYNVWMIAQSENGCLDSIDNMLTVLNDMEEVIVKNAIFYISDSTTASLHTTLNITDTGYFKNDGHAMLLSKVTNQSGNISGSGRYEFFGFPGSVITVLPTDTFSQMEVSKNNPNARIDLQTNTNVKNLVFSSNNLVYAMDDTLYITNDANTSIANYNGNRYVVGYLSRKVLPNTLYNYPLGSSSEYHEAVIDIDSLNNISFITGKFYPGTKYNRYVDVKNEGHYDSLHPKGTWLFWSVPSTPGSTSITYDLSLSLNQLNGLTDNQFAILKKNQGAPDLTFQTGGGTLPPKNTYGRMVSDGYALRTGYTSFSEFGIGMGENEIKPGIVICLRAFLEGPYSAVMEKMDTNYLFQDTLETYHYAQPYNRAPWNYNGTEAFKKDTIPSPTIIDWMLISLRSTTAASSTFDTIAVLVRNDGYIVNTNLADSIVMMAPTNLDSFYVVLQHRNHLAIMTAGKAGRQYGIYKYDFTTAQSKAYDQGAPPMKNMGAGVFAMWGANVTGDGNVNSADYTQWRLNNGSFKYHGADANLELNINAADYIRWRVNNGRSTQVPQ